MKKYIIAMVMFCSFEAATQISFTLESGAVTTQYNDVRVPNGDNISGTLFSLSDDFEESGWSTYWRGEIDYTIGEKHTFSIVAAPLTVEYGSLQLESVDFDNLNFGGSNVIGNYQFNTYRASYRYGLVRGAKWMLDLGATLLVRDAEIRLTEGDITTADDDLGYVPLVSFDLRYMPSDRLSLLLKGDALVGPVGRAEDIFAGMQYSITDDNLAFKLGYRVIEGGADVDQVYNFAFFHFASLGFILTL